VARASASQIFTEISRVLPRKTIQTMARATGVVRRQRRVDVVALIYTLVLGFSADRRRSMSGLRRVYQRLTGQTLARSSFLQRFTQPLADLMLELVHEAARITAQRPSRLRGSLRAFVEVLGVDCSVVRVADTMKVQWPAAWSHHTKAAVKITAVTNVSRRDLRNVRFSPGSRHDVHLLEPGRWMKGRLLVFDLGFFKTALFERIDAQGGFFLSRLKKQANPELLRSHRRRHSGLKGYKLKEAQKGRETEVLDFDARLTYQRRYKYRKASARFRVVAIYNERDKKWHRYVTNAPPKMLPARTVSAVYAARWEIELLFRELKSMYRAEEIPSRTPAANLCLIYASLLAMIVSRRVHRILERCGPRGAPSRMPHDRWARLFSSTALELLHTCFARRGRKHRAQQLLPYLLSEARDPNRSRQLLAERAQRGVVAFA